MQLVQFSLCHLSNPVEFPAELTPEDLLGLRMPERPDHYSTAARSRNELSVKQLSTRGADDRHLAASTVPRRIAPADENAHWPITNRPPDAIRPHMHHQQLLRLAFIWLPSGGAEACPTEGHSNPRDSISYLAAPIRLAPIAISS